MNQPELLFPIVDRATALQARTMARLSVAHARRLGIDIQAIEDAMAEFRVGWERRVRELHLDIELNPFKDMPPLGGTTEERA